MEIITKTIRVPNYLHDQIEALAKINRRSFSSQVVMMLEQAIDQSVEKDLELIRRMRGIAQPPADEPQGQEVPLSAAV